MAWAIESRSIIVRGIYDKKRSNLYVRYIYIKFYFVIYMYLTMFI